MFGLGRLGSMGGMGKATGGLSGPVPIAISDFKNGTYSVGGVSKAYSDLWGAPIVYGGNSISVVAGVGLVDAYTGVTTSASGTVVGQADLVNAVAAPDLGHSGVISVDMVGTSSLKMIALTIEGGGGSGSLEARNTAGNAQIKRTPGGGASALAGTFNFSGANKVAYTMTPTSLSISVNGGAVVTLATSPWDYTLANAIKLYSSVWNAPAGASVTVEKIAFYAPQLDAALPGLST